MASINKKIINGKPYYYARECQRVNGKPKIIWQKYLWRLEDIINTTNSKSWSSIQPPKEAIITEFWAVAALYDIAKRLRLVEFVDKYVSKTGDWPTVWTYILIAIINRCIQPLSKSKIGDWFNNTILRNLIPVQSSQLTSQRFWDNIDRISAEDINLIERDLMEHLIKEFDIDIRQLLFDATNFFTFIDTFNERCDIAQRGKSKEWRKSLRIVGLALLVTADFHIPQTYPGNQHDSPTFSNITKELSARYKIIAKGTDRITLVFDKGNNSKKNIQDIKETPYHIIGSLVPTQHSDLLKISTQEFYSLKEEGYLAVTVHRTRKNVFGTEYTIVIANNKMLFEAQEKTLLREIGKRKIKLKELQANLRKHVTGKIKWKKPTVDGINTKVKWWLSARHMKELFTANVTESKPKWLPILKYKFNKDNWGELKKTLLWKTIIFTDNNDWTDWEIVRWYRNQHYVESAFRDMKNTQYLSIRPQHHWTSQKIEVHVFYCVMSLTICNLLQRELHKNGMEYSITTMLDELNKIREVGVVYKSKWTKKKPVIHTTISKLSKYQRKLYDTLNLKQYHRI